MEFFNALIASVAGNEQQQKAAMKYLIEVDPEIWGNDDSN